MRNAGELMDLAIEIEDLIARYASKEGTERFVEHLRTRLSSTMQYLSMQGCTADDVNRRREARKNGEKAGK